MTIELTHLDQAVTKLNTQRKQMAAIAQDLADKFPATILPKAQEGLDKIAYHPADEDIAILLAAVLQDFGFTLFETTTPEMPRSIRASGGTLKKDKWRWRVALYVTTKQSVYMHIEQI